MAARRVMTLNNHLDQLEENAGLLDKGTREATAHLAHLDRDQILPLLEGHPELTIVLANAWVRFNNAIQMNGFAPMEPRQSDTWLSAALFGFLASEIAGLTEQKTAELTELTTDEWLELARELAEMYRLRQLSYTPREFEFREELVNRLIDLGRELGTDTTEIHLTAVFTLRAYKKILEKRGDFTAQVQPAEQVSAPEE